MNQSIIRGENQSREYFASHEAVRLGCQCTQAPSICHCNQSCAHLKFQTKMLYVHLDYFLEGMLDLNSLSPNTSDVKQKKKQLKQRDKKSNRALFCTERERKKKQCFEKRKKNHTIEHEWFVPTN